MGREWTDVTTGVRGRSGTRPGVSTTGPLTAPLRPGRGVRGVPRRVGRGTPMSETRGLDWSLPYSLPSSLHSCKGSRRGGVSVGTLGVVRWGESKKINESCLTCTPSPTGTYSPYSDRSRHLRRGRDSVLSSRLGVEVRSDGHTGTRLVH